MILRRDYDIDESTIISSYVLYSYSKGKVKPVENMSDRYEIYDVKVLKGNDEYPTLLINEFENGRNHAYLYSMKDNKRISPIFETLEVVSYTNNQLLKYTDRIYSSKELNGNKLDNTITGFIQIDGVLCRSVFDDRKT